MRDMDLSKADIAKSFRVSDCNGGLTIDRRHEHYYQEQCQLFVCDTSYADFVVWTGQSFHNEWIQKCHAFWEDMLPKAFHVFRVGILPEFLARCYTRLPLQDSKGATPGPSIAIDQLSESTSLPLPNKPVWCFCQDDKYEQMVACDDQNCKFQWFHFDFVGIASKSKGK
ncbi:hypothetical protein ACJMK2_042310 [Sinanodonta woodiana]|uniref:Uncharacterized protein n=1 Tax=Sinanodonta woodiana TaxID=1069815 RepID=A0ABD3W6W0_SINWO